MFLLFVEQYWMWKDKKKHNLKLDTNMWIDPNSGG